VTGFFASIEASALATWTRESASIWAYPSILTLHTVGLAVVVGAGAVVDFRLLGVARRIPPSALRGLFPIMWWAFAVNVATGVLLFMADATTKAGQRMFYAKLVLIALALVVTVPIWRGVAADAGDQARLRKLAVLSLVLWTGAIVAGRLLAYQ
jgi:hypothetical protein